MKMVVVSGVPRRLQTARKVREWDAARVYKPKPWCTFAKHLGAPTVPKKYARGEGLLSSSLVALQERKWSHQRSVC